MKHKKIEAIGLRKQGWTTTKIADTLNIPRSTARTWCRDIHLSTKQLAAIKTNGQARRAATMRQERINRENQAITEGQQLIGCEPLSKRELLLIGTALYWGEGNKTGNSVALSNSDPYIIQIFIRWLQECFLVLPEQFKACLNIHEDIDEEEAKTFWRRELHLPNLHFYPIQRRKNTSPGYQRKRLYHGVLQLQVHNKEMLYKIKGLISGLSKVPGAHRNED